MLQYEAFVETVGVDGEDSDPAIKATTPKKDKKELEGINKLATDVTNAAQVCFKNAKVSFDHARSAEVRTVADEYATVDAAALMKVSITLSVQAMQLSARVKSGEKEGYKKRYLKVDNKLSTLYPVFSVD